MADLLRSLQANIARGLKASWSLGGTGAGFDQGNWVGRYDLPGNLTTDATVRMWPIGGTHIDWATEVGDLWNIPAVQACLNWKWRNFCQAPALMQEKNAEQAWETSAWQDMAELVARANEFYDGTVLLNGVIASLDFNGNAYIIVETDKRGYPSELGYIPHKRVRVVTLPESGNFIDRYEVRVGAGWQQVPVERMLHFRFGIDPYDVRFGLSPMAAATRPGVQLRDAANYGAAMLRNFGTIGAYASPKPWNAQTSGEPRPQFDPEAFVKWVETRTRGDNVARLIATDVPIDLQWPQVTPESMKIDTLPDRSEADICALMGIPAQVAGVHVGRLSKTYANVQEAREEAWEGTLIPTANLIAATFNRQLLPVMQAPPNRMFRLIFDISNVRPLQPDKDAQHSRTREDYKAGLIDRATALQETGRVAKSGDEGVYWTPAGGNQASPTELASAPIVPVMPAKSGGNGVGHKAEAFSPPFEVTPWAQRIIREIEALEGELSGEDKYNPHHDPHSGRFAGGFPGMHAATDEERAALPQKVREWNHLHVADSATADRIAVGYHPETGQFRSLYSKQHTQAALVDKFARNRDFNTQHPELRKKIIAHAANGNEEATALRLIDVSGLRVGGEKELGKVKTYGISTLRKEHVKVEGDTIHLDFIGKKGVRNQKSVTDPALAAQIKERIGRPGDRLFNTSDVKIRNYLHSIDSQFKVHDFRTWQATAVARITIAKMPLPQNKRQFTSARLAVGERAAAHIINEPTESLKSYIDPHVFSRWEAHLGTATGAKHGGDGDGERGVLLVGAL